MNRRHLQARTAPLAVRLAVLLGASYWLMATSAPPVCDEPSLPIAFSVGPGCGVPGVIVVDPSSYRGTLTVLNARLLGYEDQVDGRYTGTSCPFTLLRGNWLLDGAPAPDGLDAGLDRRDAGSSSPNRRCTAPETTGPLILECQDELGRVCTTQLEPLP
jgi:hypothetical protein